MGPGPPGVYMKNFARAWEREVQFMNFLESEKFAADVVAQLVRGAALDDDGLDALLQAQAAVMTVRGATRAEFVEVMGLSRL